MKDKLLKQFNQKLIEKYNITNSTNPYLVIKECGVQFCTNANPIGYDYTMDEVPYWRLYFRKPYNIVDSRFDEPLTLYEVIELLKETNYKGILNAFPRITKNIRERYSVFESDHCINVLDSEGRLIVQFDYNGHILYFDGINLTGKERHKARNRCNNFKYKLFYKKYDGTLVYGGR